MISYEKVRQSLKTTNLVIILLNAIITIFALAGIVMIAAILGNESLTSEMDANSLEILKMSVTPFSLFISGLAIALNIAIILLLIKNQKRITTHQSINLLPYYLGFGLIVLNIVSNVLAQKSGSLIWALVIQFIFLALYYFAFTKAKTLNNQEAEIID